MNSKPNSQFERTALLLPRSPKEDLIKTSSRETPCDSDITAPISIVGKGEGEQGRNKCGSFHLGEGKLRQLS